ncbi:MAG: hypothetical protein A2087_06945 [Spirochaetes bacterium GWD1_61_31]|nr:MAG: hypothetical protein A2Y37_08525 [Spirochaetes bacterium GWB1_60_80]OHD28498.1 MAG: hypothetical protein A2004_14730 [Spirochaetes bacterium GWC1_61_12]OHD40257.1 MAG: hypothetical protein A2087_06945 [Spirochaetes bacterium GWD1_61_31]OHD45917.1 MAG: hypothetical protein A2Y35_04160 [Spirochaetes bacterium GWE1_60_18]OHD58500.1 MAG: hypothetical protein A2Y32_06550 [Spirochaetes bacterium GWF1_60_12]HAW85392.1 hypothetical protein [Spirochaetaceae bacterium]
MNPAWLSRLANYRMSFGKYSGRLLLDLPESYVVWFERQGFPPGELGRLLGLLHIIKENGMEALLHPLVDGQSS